MNALKVDLQGNVHVAGSRRLNGKEKGFVATLDAQGQQSAYTEFDTPALALAVDSTGAVYVAGDAFVTKVGGWTMVPPGPVRSVGVDANGHVYIAGHRPAPVGNGGTGDEAYVAKLNDESNAWAWVVPMGGTGTVNEAQSLAIDTDGSVYVAGVTNSFDFPVRNAYQDRMGGLRNAFLSKLLPDGSGIDWATYLGGSGTESNAVVALDSAGNLLVAGTTDSPNFPLAGEWNGAEDGFVARFDRTGHLLESAYVGTSGPDRIAALAVNADRSAYVAGSTEPGTVDARRADILLAKVVRRRPVQSLLRRTCLHFRLWYRPPSRWAWGRLRTSR